eukprot:GHVH01012993.1.p1 GENE.GHVH01012993.1~~GHVH01012993.1.p1  ORF type:complete len:280 (+),score=19.37 GHVH01012993.1:462-1301(+)
MASPLPPLVSKTSARSRGPSQRTKFAPFWAQCSTSRALFRAYLPPLTQSWLSSRRTPLLFGPRLANQLRPPSGTGDYVLFTDASAYGVGACLMQHQNEELQLIGYYSSSLSSQQRNWDTREREAYAIKWAVQRVKDLIEGHKVIVMTDQSSLQWARTAPQQKIQRWMWYLAQFDLQICHVSGKDNNMADWLSRAQPYPTPVLSALPSSPPSASTSAFPPPLPTIETLRLAQSSAPQSEVRQCTMSADGCPLRESILYWFHASTQGGHRGINATTRKIAK